MGPGAQAGDADAVRSAGARRAGEERVPPDELRPPGVPRDASRPAPARLPGQGAGLFELALDGQVGILVGIRYRADVYHRSEVTQAGGPRYFFPSRLTCARRFATPAV